MGQVLTLPAISDMNSKNEFLDFGLSIGMYDWSNDTVFIVGANVPGVKMTCWQSSPNNNGPHIAFYVASDVPFSFRWLEKYMNGSTPEFEGIRAVSTDEADIQVSCSITTAAKWGNTYINALEWYVEPYENEQAARMAIRNSGANNIVYRLTNCTAPSAPQSAVSGSIVNVNLQFPEGFGIINPENDVYVTNNGTRIASTYNNGLLTFTMP